MKTKLPFFKGLASLCVLLTLMSHSLLAQTTVTIGSGTDFTDVMLYKSNQNLSIENTNYYNQARNLASAWTSGGSPTFFRTLFRFNLSNIPSGAVIQSATLYLYSDPTSTTVGPTSNSPTSGSNSVYFEKVASNWGETTVTWNNQPATTTTGRIWQAASTSTTENIQVNLTSFVQNWVSNPSANYGMRMALESEQYYRGRAYASEDHANTAIRPRLVITYTVSSGDPVADKLNNIFAPLDKSQVPTGFLADYGGEFLPLDVFNGVLTDSNRVNMDAWRMAYAALYTSRIYGTNPLPTLASVNSTIESVQSGTTAIPIAITYARYGYIKPDAFTNNLLKLENEQLKDVAGRTQSPYAERFFFTASPVSNYVNNGAVALVFKQELVYNTTGKGVQSLYVDFADGRGYISVAWNAPVSATYSSDGLKLIKIKALFTDNTTYECYSQLEVRNNAVAGTSGYPSTPDLPKSFAPTASHSGGDVSVFYGNGHTAITKPLIVLEGYDPSTVAAGLAAPYDYRNFINAIDDPASFNLNSKLDMAGYDIIFLNFKDGVDDITRNAALFEEVLAWVNSQKVSGAEANVVMGLSMGGLVARYGLAKMTKEGKDTQTRLLVTHDSPHRGANVPLGFQHVLTSLPGVVVKGIKMSDASEMIKAAERLMNAPATKQMLIIRSENGNAVANTFLDNVYRPMVTFSSSGPQPSYKFIATSQGSECGQQLFAPYAELAHLSGETYVSTVPWILRPGLKADAVINALPAQGTSKRITYLNLRYELRLFWFIETTVNVLNISKNSPSYALPWDGAPGGVYSLSSTSLTGPNIKWGAFFKLSLSGNMTGEFSFVPTVSALDISSTAPASLTTTYVGGLSPTYPSTAGDFIAQDRISSSTSSRYNIEHIRFTDRNSQWIFDEMQNNFDDNSLLCSSECSPPISIASSSTLICTNSTTYLSVPPLGSGITYNWSVSSGLTIVSGSGTNQIGVKAVSGYSTGTVNLAIKNSNGCTFNIPSSTLTLGDNWYLEGTLSSTGSPIQTTNGVPIGTTYISLTTPGVTSYTWSLTEGAPYNWAVTNGSGTQAYVNLQSGQHARFDLVGYTDCSSKSTFFIVYATSSATYAVYPNPASSELNIEQVQTDGNAITVAAGSEREVDITLFDKNGKKLKTGKGKNGKLVLDVHDLPNDTYILHVNDGKEVFKHQIVIDRSK